MIWVKIASALMLLGVAIGAFGAHALSSKLCDRAMEIYKTGVFYHFVHALGLFAVAWLSTQTTDPRVNTAGIFLLVGIVLFSGSLYGLALTGIKWLGPITPLGGISFLIGWILLLTIKFNL